jgi:hypothetical protein
MALRTDHRVGSGKQYIHGSLFHSSFAYAFTLPYLFYRIYSTMSSSSSRPLNRKRPTSPPESRESYAPSCITPTEALREDRSTRSLQGSPGYARPEVVEVEPFSSSTAVEQATSSPFAVGQGGIAFIYRRLTRKANTIHVDGTSCHMIEDDDSQEEAFAPLGQFSDDEAGVL